MPSGKQDHKVNRHRGMKWGCFMIFKEDYEPLRPRLTIHHSQEKALLEAQDSIYEHLTKSIYQAIPYEQKIESSLSAAKMLLTEPAVVLAENGQVYPRNADIPLADEINKVVVFKPFPLKKRVMRYGGRIEGREPNNSILYFNQSDFLFFLSEDKKIKNLGRVRTITEEELWHEIKLRWARLNYRPKIVNEDTQTFIASYLNKDRLQVKLDNTEIIVDVKS